MAKLPEFLEPNLDKLEALSARNRKRELASFKPVDVPDFVHPGVPLSDRVWMGAKHFLYGFVLAGATALQTTGNVTTALIAGVIGGAAGATRKVYKETRKNEGKDWFDILDKLLELIIIYLRTRKGGKK